MFDQRTGKLLQRRKFEERKWKISETYREYHHDKIILGNQLSLEEDELIEYIIDSIPDGRLQDQARMQQFSSLDHLFRAFENIVLQNDSKKNVSKSKFGFNLKEVSSSQPVTCYNCNQKGHLAGSCPKPKRERGSCFYCGKIDHRFKDCPAKKQPKQGGSKEDSSTTNNTTALVEAPTERREVGDINDYKEISDSQPKEPLLKPTREYCVLLPKETEE